MTKVAFGPVTPYPSWQWVGLDTARELEKYYSIAIYTSFCETVDCDVMFIIKEKPPRSFVRKAIEKDIKLIYVPIDNYLSRMQILLDVFSLKKYHLVLSHCHRLIPLLKPYCRNIEYVDHHTRYRLEEMADYKKTGYVLWIGGVQYLPYLLKWRQDHPFDAEIKVLADIRNKRAVTGAKKLAYKMGFSLKLNSDTKSVLGCEVYNWSESLQYQMMSECKAAIDIKGERNFNQLHKPATKAQKYIASGIPFAVNSNSYSFEYFKNRGFELACPTSTDIWFSRNYWKKTRMLGEKLRQDTSLQTIGNFYKNCVDRLIAN